MDKRQKTALECNIDVAQRELDSRNAQGEDVSLLRVCQQTAQIVEVAESWLSQRALSPFMALTKIELEAIDTAMAHDKLADGYGQRNQARAMRLQMADQRCNDWRAA